MNKAALIASIATIPVLGYAPLSNATPDSTEPTKKVVKMVKPLQVGEKMIGFEIENAAGGTLSLDELLEDGPVVLAFYRGSWCPYCRGELSSIQSRVDKINQAGGTILAISPESPEKSADLRKEHDRGFNFGTDHDNTLSKQLALSFKLDAQTIKKYRQYGIDVPESNGTKKWELPIPATYVIDTDHTIKYAFVEPNYTKRADFDEVIKVLKELQIDD